MQISELTKELKQSGFNRKLILDGRGENIREQEAHELGEILASKLKEAKQKNFLVSGDVRYSTPYIIKEISDAIAKEGINVIYAGHGNVTPLFEIERARLGVSGVNVTASHQPYRFNGLKLVIDSAKNQDEIDILLKNAVRGENPRIHFVQTAVRERYVQGLVEKFLHLKEKVGFKVLYDSLQGVSFPFFSEVAGRLGLNFDGFRQEPNATFILDSEKGPDPLLEENFRILKANKKLENYDLIAIVDGDGDRVGLATTDGLVESPVISAVRACYLAEKLKKQEEKQAKFVAEYCLSAMIREYLIERGAEIIEVARGRPSHIEKILELGTKGESVVGGAEISLHHYNSQAVDDGIETTLLFLEIMEEKGKDGFYKMVEEARQGIKKSVPEIRIHFKTDNKCVRDLLIQNNGLQEKFGDAVYKINEVEIVLHPSNNRTDEIAINGFGSSEKSVREYMQAYLVPILANIDRESADELRKKLE